ncbi:MAG: hypothetical protein WBC33_10780 [Conexibacter sp.]
MGIAGHDVVPYPVFRAALDAGNLDRVRQLASQMPSIGLHDALRICLLMREHDGYERAAVRWLGRFALEGPRVDIDAIQEAAAALDGLPYRPDAAMEQLAGVCGRCGVA